MAVTGCAFKTLLCLNHAFQVETKSWPDFIPDESNNRVLQIKSITVGCFICLRILVIYGVPKRPFPCIDLRLSKFFNAGETESNSPLVHKPQIIIKWVRLCRNVVTECICCRIPCFSFRKETNTTFAPYKASTRGKGWLTLSDKLYDPSQPRTRLLNLTEPSR